MNIKKIEIQNFKNLENVSQQLDGRSVYVVGDNGTGKTSFIQAMFSTLTGKEVPEVPVTHGQKDGFVRVEFGDAYVAEMKFRQGKSNGVLRLTYNEEEQRSPRATLSQIIGDITFDVFDFLRMSDSKKLQAVMDFAGIDLENLNKNHKEIYDQRTYNNREIKNVEGKIAESEYTDEDRKIFKEEKKTDEIAEQIKNVEKTNDRIRKGYSLLDEVNRRRDRFIQKQTETQSEIEELERQLAAKRNLKDSLDKAIDIYDTRKETLSNWKQENQLENVNDLSEKLVRINRFNEKVRKVRELENDYIRLHELKEITNQYSEQLKEIEQKKKQEIQKHQLKIPGLQFTEEALLVDGLPFHEDQVPKSRIIQIGMDIMMNLNPKLKICRIKDGSLLGSTMAEIQQMADEQGYQLFVEVVDTSKDKLSFEYIER